MNYYIQGDAAKAKQIKAAFERLGYDTSGWTFNVNGVIYYTTDEGKVDMACGKFFINLIKTHQDYQEVKLPIEFKDGDIIGFNDCKHNDGSHTDWIGIYKQRVSGANQYLFHCVIPSCRSFRVGDTWRVFTAYPATKEQRDLLFTKMKEAGYQWDADKKELRKIKPHYDIANFKPFDKVLVRYYGTEEWKCGLFSHLCPNRGAKFMCVGAVYSQCIPYNDDTKHLLGTTDMCDEQYINW